MNSKQFWARRLKRRTRISHRNKVDSAMSPDTTPQLRSSTVKFAIRQEFYLSFDQIS